jgi:hypothetical protein
LKQRAGVPILPARPHRHRGLMPLKPRAFLLV